MSTVSAAFTARDAAGVEELASYILSKKGEELSRETRDPRMLSFRVRPNKEGGVSSLPLAGVAKFLRDDRQCLFRLLVDICGVDYPNREFRFEVVYHFLSVTHNMRLRLLVDADESLFVPSLHSVFPSACWYERECWDMYGIRFSDHPDLRRLLSDYGFSGHPLRKDFPLTGYTEVRYDEAEGRIVHEKVSLTQDLRSQASLMPWHGLCRDEFSEDKGL